MKQFTAVLRRAGLQADKSLITTESLHQIAEETSVPFPIFAHGNAGWEIGRVTRLWVEDDVLRGDIELDDEHSAEASPPKKLSCPCSSLLHDLD
jgi:hypothetical protein